MGETRHTPTLIIDVRDATVDANPGHHVLVDKAGVVIALCPLADDVLPNGQFSWAPDIQRALNCHDELLAALKAVDGSGASRLLWSVRQQVRAAISRAEGR